MAFTNKPTVPFLWGRGGQRLSPDAIDMQRRLAAQQMAAGSDFSPLGHWTQGLARVANSVVGGIQMNRADRAAEERQAAQEQSIAALLADYDPASGEPDPVVAALADPELRQLGMSVLEARNPKAPAPTEFEKLLTARGIEPGSEQWNTSLDRYIMGKSDPQVTVTLPGGGIFIGPQSELATVLQGGGGPASGAGATPPPPEAVEELRANPSTAAQFDEVFGAGAADKVLGGQALNAAYSSNVITPEEAARVRQSLGPQGQAAFDAWLRRNNITVGAR